MRRIVLLFALMWGCSSAAPSVGGTPAVEPSGDAGPSLGDASATDAHGGDRVPLDVACLGAVAPLQLSGGLPFVDVLVDAKKGAFLVDFATTSSAIDFGAFPVAPSATGCDPTKIGGACALPSFDFFGPWGKVTLYAAALFAPDASVQEAGVVGTDFLNHLIVTLDYAGRHAYSAKEGTLCSDGSLAAAGFVPLSTKGFFARDLSKLEPFTRVSASATGRGSVPNVPTVPVRIAGADALAQLDTGFSDKIVPFSINVNEAMLAAIQAKDPALLTRDPSRDQTLTTCAGVSEQVEAYAVTKGTGSAVELVDEAGGVARRFDQAVLFVKHTPKAAESCGGIGTWTVPAAQIAASFFVDAGMLVFDPYASRVWIESR